MRTEESKLVEKVLKEAGFEQVDAYRYNSASIRVRVVDSRFENLSQEKRDGMVEKHLKKLPREIQADIIMLLTLAPSELRDLTNWLNAEFEDPSPSNL
jgi:broad-specificity NMP kinase